MSPFRSCRARIANQNAISNAAASTPKNGPKFTTPARSSPTRSSPPPLPARDCFQVALYSLGVDKSDAPSMHPLKKAQGSAFSTASRMDSGTTILMDFRWNSRASCHHQSFSKASLGEMTRTPPRDSTGKWRSFPLTRILGSVAKATSRNLVSAA